MTWKTNPGNSSLSLSTLKLPTTQIHTRDMTDAELDEIVEKGHRFQDFPNHTQKVEAAVRVVHETATKRASHQAMTT